VSGLLIATPSAVVIFSRRYRGFAVLGSTTQMSKLQRAVTDRACSLELRS
jgi:hypothetical protein